MNAQRLFEWLGEHGRVVRMGAGPVLLVLVAAVYGLVYATGGIKYVYSHSMYIPIVLAGMAFGIRGGIFFGLLAGLVLGPFMPIVVATGEAQEPTNWLFRTAIFTLIGFLSGASSDGSRTYIRRLKWLSLHDASTGLPNRNALFGDLSDLARRKPPTDSCTLAIVSMSKRAELRSAFGYTVIEEAMQQLAARFRSGDLDRRTYRIDTGQIALLLVKNEREIAAILGNLVEAAQEPVLLRDIPIHVDMRIGYVTFQEIEEAPETYLQRADAALNAAYEQAQESIAYSPAITAVTEENMAILGELKKALSERQLLLHYQPKVGIATGAVHGVEALIRWDHPERGPVPPGTFIPRAEQSTLIQPITEFALDEAMRQMVQWQRDGIDMSIAVNISPQNLVHPGFTDMILRLLNHHGLSGEKLELEVTERGLMLDMEHAIGELARLAGAKVTISIDDFGTGYSSLQYLHRLPISVIKIDYSFVRRLPADQGAIHIVDAAVTLAHKMGMKTVAEGVENQETLDFLRNMGCDLAQGFMISRPLPAESFANWYKHRQG